MSKRKYLLSNELSIVCPNCEGKGGYKHYPDISPCNFNCDFSEWVNCTKCKGKQTITITSKHKKFINYYIVDLEMRIKAGTKKLRELRQEGFYCAERLRELNKELDKTINKATKETK